MTASTFLIRLSGVAPRMYFTGSKLQPFSPFISRAIDFELHDVAEVFQQSLERRGYSVEVEPRLYTSEFPLTDLMTKTV